MAVSLQIQSVIYKNEPKELIRTMDSLAWAIQLSRKENGPVDRFILSYGDASDHPVFSDAALKQLREKYQDTMEIRYQFFGFNSGTSRGWNLLGKDCTTDYMMIMNPDIIVTPRFFLEIMAPFADKSLNVGITEARQTPIEHPKEYDMKTGETNWAAMACVVFPTSVFCKLNGFDEASFFMYCEDVDFSWRVRMEGMSIIYCPAAVIFHAKYMSNSGYKKPTATELYCSAEAALLMAHKWSNPERLKQLLQTFLISNDENLQKAAAEFQKRRQQGTLPEPLDAEHKVAEFVDGNYTKHRYVL